jgi:hypothetical protein
MRLDVERRDLEPLLDVTEGFILRRDLGELLEQRDAPTAIYAALREQPSHEFGAAIELQPFEELPAIQRVQRACARRLERVDAGTDGAMHFSGIDQSITQLQSDADTVIADARLAQDESQLAEVPTQLCARIAGGVPEERAEPFPRHRARCQREIREQRPHFARRRQLQPVAVTRNGQRTERSQLYAHRRQCNRRAGPFSERCRARGWCRGPRAARRLSRRSRNPWMLRPPPRSGARPSCAR